MYRCDI